MSTQKISISIAWKIIDNHSEGHDSGDSGFNPGKIEESSHPDHECQSSCRKNKNNAFKCNIGIHGDFYCSPDNKLNRKQLSSNNRLWCIDDCDSKGHCRLVMDYFMIHLDHLT